MPISGWSDRLAATISDKVCVCPVPEIRTRGAAGDIVLVEPVTAPGGGGISPGGRSTGAGSTGGGEGGLWLLECGGAGLKHSSACDR
jgi:hypothetical protein